MVPHPIPHQSVRLPSPPLSSTLPRQHLNELHQRVAIDYDLIIDNV